MARNLDSSPYLDFDRETWRELRKSMPQVLTENELEELRGIGDRIDLDEVADVYLPSPALSTCRSPPGSSSPPPPRPFGQPAHARALRHWRGRFRGRG